jgi:predicted transcriptional regulator
MSKTLKNAGKAWTKIETKTIAMRVKQHTPTQKIARELGRTINSVYKHASQKGISLAAKSR